MENKLAKSDLVKFKQTLFNPPIKETIQCSPHLRGSTLQRWAAISCAVLVLSIVIICIFTLVSIPNKYDSSRTRHGSVYQDPSVSDSLLVKRIQTVSSLPLLTQDDIFISVKTSGKFHHTRLPVILETWFQLARRNTYFFTDEEDMETRSATGGHLIVTRCPSDHSRQALSCKMQQEFDTFLQTSKRWFCHFDDDQYVNVLALEDMLQSLRSDQDWYLGKPSIEKPLEIMDRDSPDPSMKNKISFWFATGGAGFCLSRHLAEKMRRHAAEGRFVQVADKMRLPDDVTMGYVVENLAKVPMTKVDRFHSHLEPLRLVTELENQISFSYSSYGSEMNVVEVQGFDHESDPTRFRSIHCHLFPYFSWCPARSL